MQKCSLQRKSSERNQNSSRYHSSRTNLKFQHKPKYHLSKSSYRNRPIIYYLGPKIPWATILCNESKHNILAVLGKANKQTPILIYKTPMTMLHSSMHVPQIS
jgi:hypothetical protein